MLNLATFNYNTNVTTPIWGGTAAAAYMYCEAVAARPLQRGATLEMLSRVVPLAAKWDVVEGLVVQPRFRLQTRQISGWCAFCPPSNYGDLRQ